MQWIEQFKLFLFDFDGLLVDTEALHFEAYRQLAFNLKIPPPALSLQDYFAIAHTDGQGLKRHFLSHLGETASWEAIYMEKKQIYIQLLKEGKCALMPGVEPLLRALASQSIKRCVVTNSPREPVEIIRKYLPILDLIPHWITREDYTQAKPSPEGYLKACAMLGEEKAGVIGFEDSLRGFEALQEAAGCPILVCSQGHPQLARVDLNTIKHTPSLSDLGAFIVL